MAKKKATKVLTGDATRAQIQKSMDDSRSSVIKTSAAAYEKSKGK